VIIFKGGRTGLLIFANPGTLNQICHSAPWISDPTVDGARVHRRPGRGRGPWVHRGPSPFKRKGTRSHPFARDLTALIKYMRRAAATTPEGGGAVGLGSGTRTGELGLRKGEGGSVCASLNKSRGREGRGGEAAAEPSAMSAPAAGFQMN
jgi:hypothetical protein